MLDKCRCIKLQFNALLGSHHLADRNTLSSPLSSRCPMVITTSAWWGKLASKQILNTEGIYLVEEKWEHKATISLLCLLTFSNSICYLVLVVPFHIITPPPLQNQKNNQKGENRFLLMFISMQTIARYKRDVPDGWTSSEAAALNGSAIVHSLFFKRKKLNHIKYSNVLIIN